MSATGKAKKGLLLLEYKMASFSILSLEFFQKLKLFERNLNQHRPPIVADALNV